MPINVGKNLKISPTNDTKISRFVRDYSNIHDAIVSEYPDTSQPVMLSDVLEVLITKYTLSYSELPNGATFVWKLGSTTLTNPCELPAGCVVDYTLTFSNGSKNVGSFIVSDNYTFDLSTLQPNKFILTITANKTLTSVRVYHNYVDDSSPYTTYTSFTNNTLSVECDKNENVRISAKCAGWTEINKLTDDQNIVDSKHIYSNITQNISDSFSFNYTAYDSIRIFLKDENNNYVEMTNDPYWNYITWTPSDSNKFNPVGVIQRTSPSPDYYNSYKDSNISVDYEINIPNYVPVTGTFEATQTQPTQYYEQTKTILPICTYTIVPNPSDATVTLAASGYNTVSGVGTQSITIAKGTTVAWIVQKQGYGTLSDTKVVNSTLSETKELERGEHSLDITDYNYTLDENYNLTLTYWTKSTNDVVVPNV